jgi:hypothetical protein
MRIGTAAFLLLLVSSVAQAQTTSTTTTGTFTLTDPDNVLGQGSVALTATNATYAATATFDSATPTQIDAIEFAAAPNGSGGTFTFDFNNGSSAITAGGAFTIDGVNSNASLTFSNGTNSTVCQAAFGSVNITALTADPTQTPSPFTNLQGNFNLTCANVPSTVNGAFTFASSTSSTPPPTQPPGPATGAGGVVAPHFPAQNPSSAPTAPPPPVSPTLGVSGPAATLIAPVVVGAGNSTTLTIATVGNSTFNAPVTLTATSDQPGPAFTFSRDTIPAPGTGTSNLTIDTTAALPGTFFVTVGAAGAGLTAATTFELDVVCDPPVITGLGQPANVTISRGTTAQLSVAPVGVGAFAYQWYQGIPGITTMPIAGANGPTLTTPPLSSTRQFWVRVSNPCGSVDSSAATVTVSP